MSRVSESFSSRRSRHTFRVHPAFETLLARHGLTDCAAINGFTGGIALRKLPNRENWRLELDDGNGHVTTLYLKKHFTRSLGSRLRAALRLPAAVTAARVEAERTREIASAGIPTMTVAAYAETLERDGTLTSAFLTEELTGFEQLDLYLPKRFSSRVEVRRCRMIEQVAEIACRFHSAGFNHRDFYTCHFFVKEEGVPGSFAIHLIDLQRVQRWPAWLRRRWIVKDLAQLAYSTPRFLVGATDRMRFFKRYLQISRLGQREKRLARSVLRRESVLRSKHGPYRKEWEAELLSHSVKDTQTLSKVA